MIKVVYVSEGLITKEDIETRGIPDKVCEISSEITFAYTEDLAALKGCGNDMRKANLRLEKEGPNWVKHSPEFLESIRDAEIIIMHYSAAGREFFDAAKKLKLLCVMRSGVENVDMVSAKEKGIVVCASPGRASEPVADFTVTVMLALMRRIPYTNMSGTGKWTNALMGTEGMMKNSIVGLIGFGVIAQKVAKRLQGFGCRIIAYDPWVSKEITERFGVEKVDSLKQVFEDADFVSLHARLTLENHGMVDKKLLKTMKSTAYLINTARAGFVNEDDLIEALKDGTIAGAGLDVFSQEPLPEGHPFLTMENVIVTPHVAGNGGDFILRSVESPLNEIRHYINGEKYDCRMNLLIH